MSESAKLTAVGLGAGLVLALALSRLIRSLMFGVGTADPEVYVVISIPLATVAAAATLLPARRAAAIEPMQALRAE